MASSNNTTRNTEDASILLSPNFDGEERISPIEQSQNDVPADTATNTENGMIVERSEGLSGDPTAVHIEVPPSLPLTSTAIPVTVATAGTCEHAGDRRERKSAVAATSQGEVRPGAVAVGGSGSGDDERERIAAVNLGKEGRQTDRDSWATKRRQARNDCRRSGDAAKSHTTEPSPTNSILMSEDETVSKSIGQAEDLKGEEVHDEVGGVEDSKAAVASTKPATIADIPPIGDNSLQYVDESREASTSDSLLSSAIPIIQAELVAHPVQAYRVSIDEEQAAHVMPPLGDVSPFEFDQHTSNDVEKNHWYYFRTRKFSLGCAILAALLIVVATCAISIPLTMIKNDKLQSENSDTASDTSPTSAPSFPYPCYTSSFEILRDQLDEERLPDAYVICPDTVIQVGTFEDPAANDFTIVDGDYPIMAVREDVVIQCGLDGKRENNCIFDGGMMQVLTLQEIPLPDDRGMWVTNTLDNLTIRGITFTGQSINSGPFEGISVMLSHPGKNIRFEDCLWKDISAPHGVVGISRNLYQVLVDLPLEDHSIDVTFSDCGFENIIYDAPLIKAIKQSVSLERIIFKDIQLSALVASQCRIEGDDFLLKYDDGCAGLLYCGPGSVCSMNDICASDIWYRGPSLVNVAEGAKFEFDNLFLNATHDWVFDNSSFVGDGYGGLAASEAPSGNCELTFVSLENSTLSNCTDIFDAPACPLDWR